MTAQSDNRARILGAAAELFSVRPYHSVSMDEIAKRAGVSKGGLFHHFSSKYDLASQALMAAYVEMWDRYVAEAQGVADPARRVRSLIGRLVDMALGNRPLGRMTLDVVAESMTQDGGMEGLMSLLGEMEQAVEAAMRESGVPGSALKASLLIAAIDNLGLQASFASGEHGIDAGAVTDELYELFVGNYVER